MVIHGAHGVPVVQAPIFTGKIHQFAFFFGPPKEPHCPDFFQIVLPVSFNFPRVLDSVKLFQFSIDFH